MKILPKQIATFLSSPSPEHSSILLFGPDSSKVSSYKQKLVAAISKQYGEEVNAVQYTYSEVKESPEVISDDLRSVQLFGGRNLVIVSDCGGTLTKTFKEFLERKLPGYVIFLAGDLAKSSALRKAFENNATCAAISCYKPNNQEKRALITQFLNQESLIVENDIIGELIEILPDNELMIESELIKLAIFKGNDKQITLQDIQDCFIDTAESEKEGIVEGLLKGDKRLIDRELQRLFSQDGHEILMVRILLTFFTKAIELKAQMEEKGLSAHQAVSAAKPPLFFKQRDNMMLAVNKLSGKQIRQYIKRLVELEIACKKNEAPSKLLIRQFLL
jgi:DNA polymerase-3 subunit delta